TSAWVVLGSSSASGIPQEACFSLCLCLFVFSMEEQNHSSGKELQHRTRTESPGKKTWHSQAYALGAVSNFMSTFLTFPIYKVVFRQQIHAVAVSEAVRQLWHEGPQYFYRGIYPPLLSKTLQGTLLFGTYDSLLCSLSPVGPHSLGHRWAAGLMSGVVEAVALSPFERVQNVLQDGRKQARFPSTFSILKEFNSYGLWGRLSLGYYRGFWPVLLRNSLGSALYFSFKDPIQDGLAEQGLPHWVPALVSGSVNGTITCLVLYPLIVLVANMQSHIGWQSMPSLWASAQDVWDTRGRKVFLIYRGGSLVILRSSVTWGLTTAIHDFLQRKSRSRKELKD
uniref:Solute carrier family 25 member 53 n=2 Tax=Canis lupus familiaris TaxID=9615 RepID=A0A8C0TH16_CANLF